MSDDQMPAWAKAMEERLLGTGKEMEERLLGTGKAMEERLLGLLETRVDADTREHRLLLEVSKAINDSETRVDADMREHRLVLEVSKAINDSETRLAERISDLRTEMTRRFDQVHDDLTVNLARADVAIERVQRLEGDVRKELSQLQRRLRELEHWRDHRPEAGP